MSPETLDTTAIDERSEPQEILAWMLERFAGRRLVLTTSFGMEGCALIDMIARQDRTIPVVYLDTMFLFPETYELRDRMIEHYPLLSFENRGTMLTPEDQAARYGPELWRRDPDECCRLRKVEPMRRALQDVDVWVTGLMRSQSAGRSRIETIEWDPRYEVIKINPLARWDRRKVWEYIQENQVPFNALHERGYPTIGCTHCTIAVRDSTPGEYSRSGRWSGTHKSECGLHKVS